MRVVQVVLSLAPGGTERLVVEIVRRLPAPVSSAVCCLDEPGSWAADVEAQGVPVFSLRRGPGFRPEVGLGVARVARRVGAAVLHCHQYTPFVYGRMATALCPSLRVVFTEHGRLSDAPPSAKRRLVNPWLGRLPRQRVFAVSENLRQHMAGEGFPAARIGVIHNGIDVGSPPTAEQRARARLQLAAGAGDVVVGTVARLNPVKQLATLVDAVGLLRRTGLPVRLAIVGDGPERPSLERRVTELDLRQHVVLLGHREDARDLLAGLDIYANSSVTEGVSLTILEAMAASLPVVATGVGGTPEVVVHGCTGLLVPPRSADEVAIAVGDLARSAAKRDALGRAGRERVLGAFTIERMVAEYAGVYAGLGR